MAKGTKGEVFRFRVESTVVERLRKEAKAAGISVSELVRRRVVQKLETQGDTEAAALVADKKKFKIKLPPQKPGSVRFEAALCRCGHKRESHWDRGCVAGCPCALRRFMPKGK